MNLDEAQRQYDKNRFSPSPSTMFHTLFGSEMMVKSYSHFFLMEPDVRPVRGGWVDRLVQEVTLDLVDFWQKGSMEYNHPHADHHLNGNGLYRLGSSDYNCFLEAVLALRYPDSFDQGQFIIMQQPDKIHQQHRFVDDMLVGGNDGAHRVGLEGSLSLLAMIPKRMDMEDEGGRGTEREREGEFLPYYFLPPLFITASLEAFVVWKQKRKVQSRSDGLVFCLCS